MTGHTPDPAGWNQIDRLVAENNKLRLSVSDAEILHQTIHGTCPVCFPPEPAPDWSACPNGLCSHSAVFHDGDGNDEPFSCCFDGCPCPHEGEF